MVNSGSFDSEADRNEKDGFTQSDRVAESPQSGISMHVVSGSLCENDFTTQTADSLPVSQAIEPTATKTEYKCNMSELFVRADEILTLKCDSRDTDVCAEYNKNVKHETIRTTVQLKKFCIVNEDDECKEKRESENNFAGYKIRELKIKPSVCCSVPLEKVQDVLKTCSTSFNKKNLNASIQNTKTVAQKDMCLYCDRTFITTSLKQKHVDRSHSLQSNRRLSARRQVVKQSGTACAFCDKLNNTECTLRELFEHLVFEHPRKYFGCLQCETRFSSDHILQRHNIKVHGKDKELEGSQNTRNLIVQEQISKHSEKVDNLETNTSSEEGFSDNRDENFEFKNEKLKMNNNKSKLSDLNSIKHKYQSFGINESRDSRRSICVKIKSKCKSKQSNAPIINEKDGSDNSSISAKRLSESVKCISDDNTDPSHDKIYFKGKSKTNWARELRNKKVSVLSTKAGMKQCLRITRQRSKILENVKNSKRKITSTKTEQNNGTNTTVKYLSYQNSSPYPSFDISFRVKKITDHSIDNIRIGSMTFDDVFDKAFFNKVKCNIQENLLNYIDGKLFKSAESENRISSFQKVKFIQADETYQNCGSKISSNAVTPVVPLLTTSQFGEDLESQIEYGAKPLKKKTVVNDEVHYKYFTRRKYQAVLSENKEHRDLSKLDMWTQLAVKNRQQKILSQKKTDKEILEYTKSDEYKVKMQVEELNKILDKRGPVEDLKEEAIRTVALEKLNGTMVEAQLESYFDVTVILNELLNDLFSDSSIATQGNLDNCNLNSNSCTSETSVKSEEIPNILNLRRVSCISQEQLLENSPTNEIDKALLVELTGEWARTRIYICAACGTKMPNAKSLIDHKNLFHEHVWCQHYEFVGNQGELYRHLSIPSLGKIGEVEENSGNKMWRRSDARMCSKCNKRFNCLGDLHRHVLECGGDWSWMLARKKYKYRPYGSKPRKKRRGLLRFLHAFRERKSDQTREKRKTSKKFTGPRQKPSDADTIQRMLANLPAKRITRKIISLKDGFQRTVKNQISKTNKNKSLKKQKLTANKTMNKSLQSDKNGIKNSSKSQRLLRSNSSNLLENRVNLVIPKRKKEINESNSRVLIRRHSVRNINKILVKKIVKSNSKTKTKLSSNGEHFNNINIGNSSRKSIETLNNGLDGNQTKDSKKIRGSKLKKQCQSNTVTSKKVAKRCNENTTETLSKNLKCIQNKILTTQGTVTSDAILQKENIETEVSVSLMDKKIQKHGHLVAAQMREQEDIEKESSFQNTNKFKIVKTKTRQRNLDLFNKEEQIDVQLKQKMVIENECPQSTTQLHLTTVKGNKKKNKAEILHEDKINVDTVNCKNVKAPGVNYLKSKYSTVCKSSKSRLQGANKTERTDVQIPVRRKNKIANKTKAVVLNIKSKKSKSLNIKNRITKIVQVDGSSQNKPSTRSKSLKKGLRNMSFLNDAASYVTFSNNISPTVKEFSYSSTLDKLIEILPQKNYKGEINVPIDSKSPVNEDTDSSGETDVDKFANNLSNELEIKILENSNINNAVSNSCDMKEAVNKSPMATHSTTKKIVKKQRGLNDCIAMLTNKLQDKGFSQLDFKNNEIIPSYANFNMLQHDNLEENQENLEIHVTKNTTCNVLETCEDSSVPKASNNETTIPVVNNIQKELNDCISNTDLKNNREVLANGILEYNIEKAVAELHQTSSKTLQKLNELELSDIDCNSNEAISNSEDMNIFTTNDISKKCHNEKEENIVSKIKLPLDSVSLQGNDQMKSKVETDIQKHSRIGDASKEIIDEDYLEIKAELQHKNELNKLENSKNSLKVKIPIDVENNTRILVEERLEKYKKKKKVNLTNKNNKSLKKSISGKCVNNKNDVAINNNISIVSAPPENLLGMNKNTFQDNISNTQLMSNLSHDDQEVMFNTSDDFSNSGKENLIINNTVNIPKCKKSKNNKNKSKRKKMVSHRDESHKTKSAQKSKLEILNSECDITESNTSELIDSEDDLPLAEFAKRYSHVNTSVNSGSAATITTTTAVIANTSSIDISSCECTQVFNKVLETENENSNVVEHEGSNSKNGLDVQDIIPDPLYNLNKDSSSKILYCKFPRLKSCRVTTKKQSNVEGMQNSKIQNKNFAKIKFNKVGKQKKYPKHRKRKNVDASKEVKNNKLVVSTNCMNVENEYCKFNTQKSLANFVTTNKNTSEEKITCKYLENSQSNVTITVKDTSIFSSEINDCVNDGFMIPASDSNDRTERECHTYTEKHKDVDIKQNVMESKSSANVENKLLFFKEGECGTRENVNLEENDSNKVEILNPDISVADSKILKEISPEKRIINVESNEKLKNSKMNRVSTKRGKKSKLKTDWQTKNIKVKKDISHKYIANTNNIFCDICNKTFTRNENLLKHKRTLTHIAKLSELEALEAVKKSIDEIAVQENEKENSVLEGNTENDVKLDLNINNLLHGMDAEVCDEFPQNTAISTFPIGSSQDSLKLVDIINDVLSKPVQDEYLKHNNFSNLILQSEPEIKRCKSLGERKSFDCDRLQVLSNTSSSDDINFQTNFVDGKISNTADVIVEKQISLLENMIEDNRINFKSATQMLISSKLPMAEEYSTQSSSSEFSLFNSSKQEDCGEITFTHNTNIITKLIKPNLGEENIIQSTQYEEISEDSSSSHFQFEEQKLRKALNRDEELFLECCSLLKSSSDVSDLCKKSSRSTQFLNNFGLKPLDEMEWLDQKQLPQKNSEFEHISTVILDDSQMNNSISDNFSNDLSYSNSNSSNCNLSMKECLNRNENSGLFSQPPIFEDISTESENSSRKSLTNCLKSFKSVSPVANNQNSVGYDGLKTNDCISPNVESAQIPEEYDKLNEDVIKNKKKIVLNFDSTKQNSTKIKVTEDFDSKHDTKTLRSRTTQAYITDFVVSKNLKTDENKKMLTKGAMKVFEGLKVSIPKEGLDMKEVLSCSPTSKRLELEAEQDVISNKKLYAEKEKHENAYSLSDKTSNNNIVVKKNVMKSLGNKLGLKVTKKNYLPIKRNSSKGRIDSFMKMDKKSHDVYDFEETQDSIDVFSKSSNSVPIYHNFRNKLPSKVVNINKNKSSAEKLPQLELCNTNDDVDTYYESDNYDNHINVEEKLSCDSSSLMVPPSKKVNMHKSITKKKCMIMGRIFKNAIKSKISDEIKNIPTIENSKIVEDYVQDCQNVESKDNSVDQQHKLSEEEMNVIFDNLLNEEKPKSITNNSDDISDYEISTGTNSSTVKLIDSKPKQKISKCKKRQKGNFPDSSDEEFSIRKFPKKQCNKKSSTNNDCVINLEQELKECIGVASRKSQRKCTSGKQNVLVEYWSSDESSFDIEPNFVVENISNRDHQLSEASSILTTSQNVCSDKMIFNTENQENDSTLVLPDTNTYDVNSSNSKDRKEPVCNERSQPISSTHITNKKILKTNKHAEISKHDIHDSQTIALRRQKRAAVDTLYYWSSSSEDELQDVVEVKPLREEYDEEDRPLQQGWIVGDSPKKLVTMLAQAKGKKVDAECVKKNRKKRTSV